MNKAYLCEGARTPIGRFGGALSSVRPDDLLATTIKALAEKIPALTEYPIDDVLIGCANQAGEDNRNVARMAVLLSGLPVGVPASTLNRLCGSGLDAVGTAARAINSGAADLIIAGGVESMSRAPFVMPKAQTPFSRNAEIYDTTIGWRFVNKAMEQQYGIDSMPDTAENVAEQFNISRQDQDRFALHSQEKAQRAVDSGRFDSEICPVTVFGRKGEPTKVSRDEHPRLSSLEKLSSLATPFRENGTVTAGNASGVNDGACALLVASDEAVKALSLTPTAEICGMAVAGVDPKIMGIGPVPASRKLLQQHQLKVQQLGLIELNEAFAAQSLAVLRELRIDDEADFVNPNGGAIALGHPLGMSGARLALTSGIELSNGDSEWGMCSMCIGVGQGISLLLRHL